MPHVERLAPKLRDEPGACAYACQCSSRTVRGEGVVRLADVENASQLRWVCRGH